MRSRLLAPFLVLGAVLPGILLAGCIECPSGPPVTARGISPTAGSTAGLAGFALTILVTDEPGGPALPGAGVVVYWAKDDPQEWRGNYTVTQRGGEISVAVPGNAYGTPEAKSVHRLATDSEGRATARVPGNRIVGVVVAHEGYTEEWIPALATGASSAGDTVTVPLYRANLTATLDGTWGPGGASPAFVTGGDYAWKPEALAFGATPEAHAGYVARLARLEATLTWNNGFQGGGDLAVGVGPARDQPTFVHDSANQATPGDHVEDAVLTTDQLAEIGLLGAPAGYIGPASDSAFVAPFGLPYHVELRAEFDTAKATRALCSGAVSGTRDTPVAGVLPVLGIVAAAALARRSRASSAQGPS